MSAGKPLRHYKQHINLLYSSQSLSERYDGLTSYYGDLRLLLQDVCPSCNCSLEISHRYSPVSSIIGDAEKFFLSDDDFVSLLSYHCQPDVQSFNYPFNAAGFDAFGYKDKFSLIISDFGLDYDDMFGLLRYIMTMLECGGCFVAVVPAYWFIHNDMNEDETALLSYSRQTDRKWIFPDSLEAAAEECGGKAERIAKLPGARIFDRAEAANMAGLAKLYNAECSGDAALLETVDIPQSLRLSPAAAVIRKEKKMPDKNNLFNI